MADAAAGTAPLASQFRAAEQQWLDIDSSSLSGSSEEFQDQVRGCAAAFNQIGAAVRALALFSPNEVLDDINTTDLKYILVPFYLGDLHLRAVDHRAEHVARAKRFLETFLDLCDNLNIMHAEDKNCYHKKLPTDAATNRQVKVERFRRNKAAKDRRKALLDRKQRLKTDHNEDDEEDCDRDILLATIEAHIHAALDHLGTVEQEASILQYAASRAYEDEPKHVPAPLKVTHIPSRADVRATVFVDPHSKPLYSVEEWGAIEHQMAMEAQRNAPPPKADPKLDAEDEEEHEAANLKQRHWENWKDDHPPHGNTKRF